MGFVHHNRTIASLSKVPDRSRPRVDISCLAPMQVGKSPAQPILIGWDQYTVNMVRHQAIGPYLTLSTHGALGQHIQIKTIVGVLENTLPRRLPRGVT